MIIKKYLKFILESNKSSEKELKRFNNIDEIYPISDEDIEDYYIDFKTAGYNLTINRGFIYNDSFTEIPTSIPSYKITISLFDDDDNLSVTLDDDLTNSIEFVYNIIEDLANAEILIELDGDLIKSLDSIRIKDKKIIRLNNNGDIMDSSSTQLSLIVKCNDEFYISDKQIVDIIHINTDGILIEGDDVFLEIDQFDLSNLVLARRSSYKDELINGIDYDDYFNYSYTDTSSFLQYNLNKDFEELLIKSIIKEIGGIETFNDEFGLVGTEEEVIKEILNERNYETLTKIVEDSDLFLDIKNEYNDWCTSAHVSENEKELESEFDDLVGKNFTYTKRFDDGVSFYKIRFDVKFYSELIGHSGFELLEDFENYSLESIIEEWYSNECETYELDPSFSDYGNVDDKAFNLEKIEFLKKYLEK